MTSQDLKSDVPKPPRSVFGSGLPLLICLGVSIAAAAYFNGDWLAGCAIGVIAGGLATAVFDATHH